MTTIRSKNYMRLVSEPHPTEDVIDLSKLAVRIKDDDLEYRETDRTKLYAIVPLADPNENPECYFKSYEMAYETVRYMNTDYDIVVTNKAFIIIPVFFKKNEKLPPTED